MPLDKITRDDVENWFDKLIEEEYQNTAINGYYGTLKTMLIEAVARKLIDRDPAEKMGRLVKTGRKLKSRVPCIKADRIYRKRYKGKLKFIIPSPAQAGSWVLNQTPE